MNRPIFRIIRNAITVVLLVLAMWWVYETFLNPPSPPPTEEITHGQPVLEAIKQVNKQLFVEHYNTVDVQYSEAPEGLLSFLGDLGVKQEFIVLLRGRVPAGIDLQELSEDDIWMSSDGKRVQLTLPPPMIFEDNVSIDLDNSRMLAQSDRCPGFICPETMLDAYEGKALPQGRDLLIEFALQSGILDQCATDGKAYYEQFLRSLGFEKVRVIVSGYGV